STKYSLSIASRHMAPTISDAAIAREQQQVPSVASSSTMSPTDAASGKRPSLASPVLLLHLDWGEHAVRNVNLVIESPKPVPAFFDVTQHTAQNRVETYRSANCNVNFLPTICTPPILETPQRISYSEE